LLLLLLLLLSLLLLLDPRALKLLRRDTSKPHGHLRWGGRIWG
jgi:hypothetical protein